MRTRTMRQWWLVWVMVGAILAACGSRERRRGDGDGDGPGADAGRTDAGERAADAGRDGGRRLDASAADGGPDAGSLDGGARTDAGGADGSLDPALDPADPAGIACTIPGNLGECPSLQVCRFYSPTESRCESCDACGNLGDPCTDGTDCDILFACYAGGCANICQLDTPGCPGGCVDIGHPTHGVCPL